uniref:hypothetical protein n=1 Tax=Anaerococcus mediterraneensis TaxID=1870984 RepID=UPI0009305914|nr:hypothetical protein [Anaerococcus mediterraneensis]
MKIAFYTNSDEPCFISFLVESKEGVGNKDLEIGDLKERYDDGIGNEYMKDLDFDCDASDIADISEYLNDECDGDSSFDAGDVAYEAFYIDYSKDSEKDFDDLLDYVSKKVGFHDLEKYRKYIQSIEFAYPREEF